MPSSLFFYGRFARLLGAPSYVFHLFLAIPLIFFLTLLLLYKWESEKYQNFIAQLEGKKEKILALKLAGAEPFLWKPILSCKDFSESHNKTCVPLIMYFGKNPQKGPGLFVYEIDSACLICHRDRSGQHLVMQSSHEPPTKPKELFYRYSVAFFCILFFPLYLSLWYRRMKLPRKKWWVISFAFGSDVDQGKIRRELIPFLKQQKPSFLYGEYHAGLLSMIWPVTEKNKWLENIRQFFLQHIETYGRPAACVHELSYFKWPAIPYEELYKTATFAQQVPKGYLILPEHLENYFRGWMHEGLKRRSALYKKKKYSLVPLFEEDTRHER
ncbi:MAG: hypothetical protein NZM25_11765 [Leptospiraceae bacterium]|nr:hypothetical protein [Leptospiraceae bacterium]MDW8307385.1 hypothetical protein [Leptospiraceae bacterium]